MKIDKETENKLQELQLAEQNLQNFLIQKQAFQLELNETESAVEEAEKSSGEIYKIVGQVMVKTKKLDVLKELQEKKEILNLRIKTIENQEKILKINMEKTRGEIEEKLKEKPKK